MIGSLTENQFDAIEIIRLLGGTVGRDEFALRIGITPESASTRLRRMLRAGLLVAADDPNSGSGAHRRGLVYRVSAEGERRFDQALSALDAAVVGEPPVEPVGSVWVEPPRVSGWIEVPALLVSGLLLIGEV